jgi:hypothetical protein
MRVRFPIENVDSRARFQTPIKKMTGVVSMPEEDVPQLSADAPFRSIRKPIASPSGGFRASPSVPTPSGRPGRCSLKAVFLAAGIFLRRSV